MSNLQDAKDDLNILKVIDTFDGEILNPTDADKDFLAKNTNRIDIAHIKAEEYCKQKNVYFKNIGFDPKNDKIPSKVWWQIPDFIKSTPDMFIIINNVFMFLEIKGCRDNVNIKFDDIMLYSTWNGIADLMIFVYSTTKDSIYIIPFDDLDKIIENSTVSRYNDNKKLFFSIDTNKLVDYKR